jgi:hypothetical protein
MREALVQSVRRRRNNIFRRIEIGLADLEMNNLASFRFQRSRFHQHFERGLGPKTRHAVSETKFARLIHQNEVIIAMETVLSTPSTRFRAMPAEYVSFERKGLLD